MKTDYPIEWAPVAPDYILASLREGRQCALLEGVNAEDVERCEVQRFCQRRS